MNKKYIIVSFLASAFACFSLSSSAQRITDDADIKIEGLSIADFSASGVIHNGGGSKNSVKLVIPNYPGVANAKSVQFQTVSCQCFGQTSGVSTVNAALFANDEATYQKTNYPYIQIEPANGTVITDIVFECLNGNSENTSIQMGFGVSAGTGTGLGNNDFTAIQSDLIPGVLSVSDNLFIGYKANVSEFAKLQLANTEKISIPSDKQTIRMVASKEFPTGGVTITGKILPWNVVGIYIWTNGIPSSVNETNANSFQAYVANDELNFTEAASQVAIYNISGQLIQTSSNIQTLLLNNLSTGIYVVKATSTTGKTLVTKIAR